MVVSGLESRVLEKTFDIPHLGYPGSVVTKSTLVPDPAGVISRKYMYSYTSLNEKYELWGRLLPAQINMKSLLYQMIQVVNKFSFPFQKLTLHWGKVCY